jgi:hypothetical protein
MKTDKTTVTGEGDALRVSDEEAHYLRFADEVETREFNARKSVVTDSRTVAGRFKVSSTTVFVDWSAMNDIGTAGFRDLQRANDFIRRVKLNNGTATIKNQ